MVIPAEGQYLYDEIGNLIRDNGEGTTITWMPYGKVRSVTKDNGDITTFQYDVTGNRIAKSVTAGDTTITTHYIRDASGNVMATYTNSELKEQPIYGSSRVGMYLGDAKPGMEKLGLKHYELGNHPEVSLGQALGNVLAVITDNINIDSAEVTASVVSVSDYYPFGLGMPGRTFSSDEYRYGFNGKEKDPDGLGGGGSTYDYGFRIYNPGIAKFLSVDPLTNSYPWYTPYQFAGNKPIWAIDLDGLEEVSYTITLDVEFSKNIPEWIPFGAWSFDAEILPTGKISDYFVEEGAIANYYIIMRIPTHAVPYGNSYRITHYDTYVYSGNNLQGIKDLKNWDREPDLQWAFVNGLRAGVFSALLYDFLNQTQVQSESPNSSEPESDAPNPYGSKGKPDHQKKVEDDNERLTREYKDDSERTVLREQKVQGHDLRRYPDNQIVKDGKTEKIIEREKNPNSPYVRGKEKDYQKHNIPYEIWDLNKNVPIRSWSPQ